MGHDFCILYKLVEHKPSSNQMTFLSPKELEIVLAVFIQLSIWNVLSSPT